MPLSLTTFSDPNLQRYIGGGHRRVDGWLSNLDAALVANVGRFQTEGAIEGAVGEIGVHHGRLFILLALLLRPGEAGAAIDLFDDQQFNVDQSGRGDEAAFRRNLARFGVPADAVRVIRGNSMDLKWPTVAAAVGAPMRLFSVDGGHTSEITHNDLCIAEAGLAEAGVIVLDDYFNPEFPAVSEGLCRFMIERPGLLHPIAIGDNKLLLGRPAWADRYRAMLMERTPSRNFVRTNTLFGETVAIFRTPGTLMQRIRQTDLARRLRDHPVGLALKPIVRRFVQG